MTSAVSLSTAPNIADILNKNSRAASDANSSTGNGSPSNTANDAKDLDKQENQFLLLLTKQLQNQDPLNPMDSTQFTQQLAQFSQVEQAINQNKRLDQLIGLQSSTNTYAAASFLGNRVAVDSNQIALENKGATFQYKIEHQADKALLRIADAKGNIVAIQEANSAVGSYEVNWNGQDASGHQLPDGLYQVSVQYVDSTGQAYSAPITAFGVVDSADVKDGKVNLNVGDASYSLDKILKIVKPSKPS